MFATRAQALAAYDAANAERTAVEERVATSKRYRGRANDLRLIASLTEICWAATGAINAFDCKDEAAEYEAWEQEDIAATQRASDEHQAFRARVAERAYFMALNGEGESDHERWLWAEGAQRGADIQAKRDASDEREWLSPAERRRRERAVGLH